MKRLDAMLALAIIGYVVFRFFTHTYETALATEPTAPQPACYGLTLPYPEPDHRLCIGLVTNGPK